MEAGAEDIKVLDEDINNGFDRIAKQYNMTIPEVKGYFKSRDDMLPFISELLNEKILKFLSDESKFIEIAAKEEKQPSGSEVAEDKESTVNKENSGE